jgi:PncC family amidohydrolase
MKLNEEIVQILLTNNQTLATAESCTGGALAYEITQLPGVSSIFLGGIVSYANEAKTKLLSVPKDILLRHGAVSKEVALLMAENCKKVFSSTWALATTGIAGPSGGSKEKPVGLVWISVAGPNILHAYDFLFANISRIEHQQKTLHQALSILKAHLASI